MNKSSSIKAQAQKHLSNGNLDRALAEYEKLLSMEDVDPYDFVLAGDVHLKKGSLREAVSHYEKAMDAYEKLGLYKNAAAIGKRVLRLNPTSSEIYRRLGEIRLREGLTTEAIQDMLRYSEIKVKDDDFECAIHALESACKACPKDTSLSDRLTVLYERTNKTAEAAREFARVSEILRERGDEEGAATYYEKALKTDAEALSAPQGAQGEPAPGPKGTPPEAEPGGEEVPSQSGGEQGPAEAASSTETPAGEPEIEDSAIPPEMRTGSIHVTSRPRSRPATVDITEVLRQFKSQVEGKIGTDDHQSHYDLGVTYKEMGLHEEALNEFRVAMAGENHRVKSLEMAGVCHLEMGEYEEALEAFRRAIRERDSDAEDYPGLCFSLGTALEALGNKDEALDKFREVASLNPDFPGIQAKLESLGENANAGVE
ncbi:MAG: tetratricopeptide repeat protein [Candidatus Eisenbacteria bacterium]